MYQATITFEMIKAKKASNVRVMVIYPNNTIEYHDVSSSDANYRLNITKNVEELALDKSNDTSPEFMITWMSGNKKKIQYVYSSVR
jgi:carbamoylphosphate synthase large subunit